MLELLFETDIITTRHENHNDTISGYSQLLNSFLYEVFARKAEEWGTGVVLGATDGVVGVR